MSVMKKYIRKFRKHGNRIFATTLRGRSRHEAEVENYGSSLKEKNCNI